MYCSTRIGILFLALAAGCAGVKAPPGVTARSGPLAVDPALVRPDLAGAVAAPPSAGPRRAVVTGGAAIAIEPEAVASAPPLARSPTAATAVQPFAEAPAVVTAAPPAMQQPRTTEVPPPVARTPQTPLDVAGLTARLRDTNAIGVFTKLALKNQVDDLLMQFRAHHQGGQRSGVASLRQPYDMLVLKVLSVVQDKDPSLALAIAGSREAIWGILADPQKFNSVA